MVIKYGTIAASKLIIYTNMAEKVYSLSSWKRFIKPYIPLISLNLRISHSHNHFMRANPHKHSLIKNDFQLMIKGSQVAMKSSQNTGSISDF